MTMDVFFEAKPIVRILYFLMLFAVIHVEADKFECIKYDECSCRIETATQQEMSLWRMPSGNGIESDKDWLFDFNLCHGLNKNTDAPDGGCRNATVCQYLNKEAFDVGHFGNVTFGQYDNETKSIMLQYYGILQGNVIRSININLTCDEKGNVSKPSYNLVYQQSVLSPNKFKTIIKTKAACLRTMMIPTSPGDVTSSSRDKLKTGYIVLIAVAGFVIVLALGSFVGYKIAAKRKRGLLNEKEQNEDYGTVPQVHIQNALSTPGSGPI